MKTEKIDIFKLHKTEYKATGKPVIVNSSRAMYLSVEGKGAPGSDAFQVAVNSLYSMAYTIKMGRKADGKGDYTIGKLEGIYWTVDGTELDPECMEKWCWKLMIRTPEKTGSFSISTEDLATAHNRLLDRKKGHGSERIEIYYLEADKYVQMLHVGPYDTEPITLAAMLSFCEQHKLSPCGRHHEIYLSDPRRVKPENLKTILRISVK